MLGIDFSLGGYTGGIVNTTLMIKEGIIHK